MYKTFGISIFQSYTIIYSCIVDQSINGSIVGGALMPKLQGMIIDLGGTGVNDTRIMGVTEVNFSFLLPFLCFIFIAYYGRIVAKQD